MINMTDRPYIHMRLRTVKLLLRHRSSLSPIANSVQSFSVRNSEPLDQPQHISLTHLKSHRDSIDFRLALIQEPPNAFLEHVFARATPTIRFSLGIILKFNSNFGSNP
jgi:hypothetical protein